MRIWCTLKALGCAALRDGVYLLPRTDSLLEQVAVAPEDINRDGGAAWLLQLLPVDDHAEPNLGRSFDVRRCVYVVIENMVDGHATGIKPTYNAKDVYQVSKPRKNLAKVNGWTITPFLGTSSYAAFTPMGKPGELMVVGDNVLHEDEVGPAMDAALQNGLEVTALHNHFFHVELHLYFMQRRRHGRNRRDGRGGQEIARLAAVGACGPRHATPATVYAQRRVPAESVISAVPLDATFGKKGESNNVKYEASFGRAVKMHGMTAGEGMGVNNWAGFADNDQQAMVDGDFAVHEGELHPVLKSLRGAGINIVAIRQHMTGEEPRLIFFHYWGQGKAQESAKTVRAAIDLPPSRSGS